MSDARYAAFHVLTSSFVAPFAALRSVSVMRGGQGTRSYVSVGYAEDASSDSNAAHLRSKSAHFSSDADDAFALDAFSFAFAFSRFRSFFSRAFSSRLPPGARASSLASSSRSTRAQCSASANSRASLRRVSSSDSAPWYPPPPTPKRPRVGLCASSTHLEPFHVAPGGPVRSGSTPSLAPRDETSLAYPSRSSTRYPRACAHDAHSTSDEPMKAQRATNA